MKEKVLRGTQIRNIHEMVEIKRSQELGVDEVSVRKLRENHETIQQLTSQLQQMSHVPSQRAVIPSPRSMLSRGKRLPLDTWNTSGIQKNVFGNHVSTCQSSRKGIHHSTTPGTTGSLPVHIGTGTPVARDEGRIKGTTPMPTFARRPSTMNSSLLVEIPLNSSVGQQRQQMSELQFDKFPSFHVGR